MDAIGNVLELIRRQLNTYFQNMDRRTDDWVILSNVVDNAGELNATAENKVVMSLASIAHETVISTYTAAVKTKTSSYAAVTPPLYIDLYIVFYANFVNRNYLQGLKMISRTISFFQQNPAFTRDTLPALDPGIDRIVLEFTNLDMVQVN